MILLDTHIWIWWVNQDAALPSSIGNALSKARAGDLAISAISCWEVAKLVEKGRLEFSIPLDEWMALALEGSAIEVLPITPSIAIASTQLPNFPHTDPADQLIVATARVWDCPLASVDGKIMGYRHVEKLM